LPKYNLNPKREVNFEDTAEYVREFIRNNQPNLVCLDKFTLHHTEWYKELLMACQDKITLEPCFNLFLLVNYLALVLHHCGSFHHTFTPWLITATQAAIEALTTHGVPCTPVTAGQIESLMSQYRPYSPLIPSSNTLHLLPLSKGATARQRAPQPPAASNTPTDSTGTNVTPSMKEVINGVAQALVISQQALEKTRKQQKYEALEETLEVCIESLTETTIRTFKEEVKLIGEGLTSTGISSLEELWRKQEQINRALRDGLKGQIKDLKDQFKGMELAICSELTAKQDSHFQAQLLENKNQKALSHDLLDQLSTLTRIVKELNTENKELVQQLSKDSVITQGESTTSPSSVEDSTILKTDLATVHETDNTSNPVPETQDTPIKDKGPNITDPTSPYFDPNKGVAH